MSSAKGRILGWLGRFVLRDAEVVAVDDLGPAFRRVHLRGPPSSVMGYRAGDKVQVLLPTDDVRTYTPIGWGEDGTTSLLVFRRDEGPAGPWVRALQVGARVRFVGPQRSLSLPAGPAVLVGDETSLAVAAALRLARPDPVRVLLELGEVDATSALAALGLSDAEWVRRRVPADHLDELADLVGMASQVAITGGGDLVRGLRSRLRSRGAPAPVVKTYWVAGQAGLD